MSLSTPKEVAEMIGFTFVSAFVLGALIAFLIIGVFIDPAGNVRQEAVKVGVAQWVPDGDGKPQFKWKAPVEKVGER